MIRLSTIGLVLGLAGAALAQGRSGSETEEEQTFQAAEEAFKSNQFDEAMRLYEKVTAINPQRADPWVKRAVILYNRKAYSEAVTLLRVAQKTLPNDVGVKAQLGLSLYKAGAPDPAVAIMEEVVAAEAGKYEVQLQLGQHYLKIGDGKRATAALEAYFKSRPQETTSEAQIRTLYGTALLLNRQYADAERELTAVLKKNPNDVITRVHLGEVYTATGDCSKAINIFERLVPEAAKQPSIHYNLGTCYLKVNRKVEAQRSAEAYVAARPRETKGHLLVGDARFENHDLLGSLTAYEQAAKIDPARAPAARMGKVYLAQKNYPAAVGVLEKAAEGNPNDLELQAQLAEAYGATKQPKEKLLAIAERLAKSTDPDAQAAAAAAFYSAGDDARAEKLFEAALATAPQNRRAKNGLSMALQRGADAQLAKGNLAAAEAALVRAQKLDADSIQGNRNLGLVLLLEKKFSDAEKVLKLALKKVPRDVVVNRLIGRAYLGQKNRAEAIKAYEAAAQTALRTRGPALAEVYAELGPVYVEAGNLDQAVTVLDTAVKEAGQMPVGAVAQRNLAIAWYRRGLERMKDGKQADLALEDLARAAAPSKDGKSPLSAKELSQVQCAAALAALKAGKAQAAQDGFARAIKEGGCQWKPPFDKVGTEFFAAYAQYRDNQSPAHRDAAARIFQKLLPKATGSFQALLRDLIRSSYELEAYDYWVRGDEKKAAAALKSAAQMAAKGGKGDRRNLDHNLAVIDLVEGKTAQAEKALEELGQRPPEALVNLGILADRQGDSKRALELYKRAVDKGAHAPKLREWIDVKERLLAGAAAAK